MVVPVPKVRAAMTLGSVLREVATSLNCSRVDASNNHLALRHTRKRPVSLRLAIARVDENVRPV
jgi:hypothetical protein